MMSARLWRDRRVFWHALIFWAWLASFAFGFAARDLFHAPNCPEQLALRAAHHRSASGASKFSAPSESHALQIELVCLSCLLQLDGQGIIVTAQILAALLVILTLHARPILVRSIARPLIYSARGPPLRFI